MHHRPRSVAASLLAAVLLGGCQGEAPYVPPEPTSAGAEASPTAAAGTLAALEDALRGSDGDAAAAIAVEPDVAETLTAAAANVRRLRMTDIGLRYLSETGQVAADGGWSASVELTWRLRGFDQVAARAEVGVAFAAGGTGIAGLGATGHLLPLWLSGPVSVVRGEDSLVVGSDPATGIRRYAGQASRAADAVDDLLPGERPLVVEVPATAAQLHTAIGQDPGTYDAVAAVTTSADGSLAPGSPVHVFLNPAVYSALGPTEAQVVMTHEAVHAVTEAPLATSAPLWLLEGFADYVALREADLPVTTAAAQVIDEVQADGLPSNLPDRVEFDTEGTHLGAAYEAAWLACATLADRGGEAALVALYSAVLRGADVEGELRRRFGWSLDELVDAWRARLADLAGVRQ